MHGKLVPGQPRHHLNELTGPQFCTSSYYSPFTLSQHKNIPQLVCALHHIASGELSTDGNNSILEWHAHKKDEKKR
jgi:hypothetical protein